MKGQVIDYDTAVKLKELGFNEKCFAYYSNYEGNPLRIMESVLYKGSYYCGIELCYLAPIWQQVKQWLWKKHLYFIEIVWEEAGISVKLIGALNTTSTKVIQEDNNYYYNPVSAEIAMMKFAIEYLCKNK